MLRLTKTGLGLLTRQYRSVLRKCWLINVGLFALGATAVMTPSEAGAATADELVPGVKASVFDEMKAYIADSGHGKYNLSTTKGTNTHSVVIGGTTYYYTPNEKNADMQKALEYLAASQTVVSGTSSDYVFRVGWSTYYKYNTANIPSYEDKYKVVETHMGDTGAWAEKQSVTGNGRFSRI